MTEMGLVGLGRFLFGFLFTFYLFFSLLSRHYFAAADDRSIGFLLGDAS